MKIIISLAAIASAILLTHITFAQTPDMTSNTMFNLDSVKAPVALKKPKDVSVHGDKRIDDYFWMRSASPAKDAELMAHLRAENAYADAVLKPVDGLKGKLYAEMLARIKETDESIPYQKGSYWYNSKTEKGKQYPKYVRRQGTSSAPDTTLLDVNALAKGKKFMSVRTISVSPNAKLVAYTTNETGGLEATLKVRNIATQKDFELAIKNVSSVVWAGDNQTIYYSKIDAAKRPFQVWRHVLGSSAADVKIFEETDEAFWLDLFKTGDDQFIGIGLGSKDTSEIHMMSSTAKDKTFFMIEPRTKGVEYSVVHRGNQFYIAVNDKGPNFRLVGVADNAPSKSNWKELIPHRADVFLEDIQPFVNHLVVLERKKGVKQLRVFDFPSAQEHVVEFDEPSYEITLKDNREFSLSKLRFEYQSLTTPPSLFDYDMSSRKRQLLKKTPVLGGFDSSKYTTERIQAKAPDGTAIPISLVYRTDMRAAPTSKPQPLLLDGYGSYGVSSDPYFSSSRVSLLDRGVIFAIAHVRGGADLGRSWYDDGKLAKKMNTFTDFIACAQALIDQGYTSKNQLIAHGGSAGGLLMGAVANLRPDLFSAIVAEVPFVDVINTMLDETIPLTVGEFLEWGNPKVKDQYDWIRAYSPYDNLSAKDYPTIYMRAGLNDNQVSYWEPAKYVAKLRTLKTNAKTPVLFHVNLDAGHGGSSGRYDALKERAQVYAFMLGSWGLN